MRKIIFLVTLIAVLAGLAAAMLLRYHRPQDLLTKAQQSLQQGDPDSAALLAKRYAAAHPQDWKGFHVQALALLRLGQYTEARVPLKRAMAIPSRPAAVPLALAQSYSLPAAESTRRSAGEVSTTQLETILRGLEQANQILYAARPAAATGEDQANIGAAIGLNHYYAARILETLSDRLAREASLAEAAGDASMRDYKRAQSQIARSQQSQHHQQAQVELLAAAAKARDAYFLGQPTPELIKAISSGARAAAELAVQDHDAATLGKLRPLIAGLEDKAPQAAVLLITQEPALADSHDALAQEQRRQDALKQLEHLLDQLTAQRAAATGIIPVKLAIAEMSITVSNLDAAERLCDSVLRLVPKNHDARLTRGRVLMQKGDLGQAERVLFILKTDYPLSAPAQFAYAQVARARGKLQLAREAYKAAVDNDVSLAAAREGLVESLLHEGLLDMALDEAQAYHWSHADDPRSLAMVVKAALRKERIELARQILGESLEKFRGSGAMLCAIVDGYMAIGDTVKARDIAQAAIEGAGDDPDSQFALARMARGTRQYAQAELILQKEITQFPNWRELHLELGHLLLETARQSQAIDEFRTALNLDTSNSESQLALASALFETARLNECEAVLKTIRPSDADASLLYLQLRLLRGEAIPTEEVLQQTGAEKETRMLMARACFAGDQLDRCIEICRADLVRHPSDPALQCLLARAYLSLAKRQLTKPWAEILSPDRTAAYVGP